MLSLTLRLTFGICIVIGLAACSTSVERKPSDETIDLSGAWNDTDSQQVSKQIIDELLQGGWLVEYRQAHRQRPTVIMGEVRNLSHEHINVRTFVADIERAVINSGRVRFVASKTERTEIRGERKDQDLHARDDTRKAMGQEIGADFMLKGSINTIIDTSGKTQVRYYQVDLNLISLTDNTKVWVGQKKIKKLVKRSKLQF